jgi:WD40 repeat protein
VNGVAFSPGRFDLALSASSDKTMALWDLNQGTILRRFEHNASVIAVAPLPDGKQALTADAALGLTLWDLESGAKLASGASGAAANSLVVDATGAQALVGGASGKVRLISLPDLKLVREWQSGPLSAKVAFFKDGKRFVAGSSNGRLRLYDTSQSQALQEFQHSSSDIERVADIALSSDEAHLVAATGNDQVLIFGMADGKLESKIRKAGYPTGVHVIGGGLTLLTHHSSGMLRLWSGNFEKPQTLGSAASRGMSCADVSSDSRFVITGSGYGAPFKKSDDSQFTVRLWRLPETSR